MCAVLGIFTGTETTTGDLANKTKKEMNNQFNAIVSVMSGDNGKGICFQIRKANKMLTDKGLKPLSSKEGGDIEYVLTYCNTGSVEQDALYLIKDHTGKWLLDVTIGPSEIWLLQLSWSIGIFTPIEARYIQGGAYCHRKGDISSNQKYKRELLKEKYLLFSILLILVNSIFSRK